MMDALKDFKNLKINKYQLQKEIGDDLYNVKTLHPIKINNMDVVNLLECYKRKEITTVDLVDWVNVVWFTELFSYSAKYQDSIASVMSELEELDETGNVLTPDKIDLYIHALKTNKEI